MKAPATKPTTNAKEETKANPPEKIKGAPPQTKIAQPTGKKEEEKKKNGSTLPAAINSQPKVMKGRKKADD
jgi:hypothetical protein